MLYSFLYFFIFSISYDILNSFYLSKFTLIDNIETIFEFNYYLTNLNIFAFSLYSIYLCKCAIYGLNSLNGVTNYSILLSLIYLRYVLDIILYNNLSQYIYEFKRLIMWVFTTPLMLKIYCDMNKITIQDIKIHYYIIPVILNVFMFPFKYNKSLIYLYFLGACGMPISIFLYQLYINRNIVFGNLFLYIWITFIGINMIDILGLADSLTINIFYTFADFFSKIITNIIINDYNEKKLIEIDNIDIQSINFIENIIKTINLYCKDNILISSKANKFITNTKNYMLGKIPTNQDMLQKELLEKILPFGYSKIIDSNLDSKKYKMICVFFTDIVNYTELAKQFDAPIIFELLDTIFNKFDAIIKKYPHIQKIETIGDAYMVVGDIYRSSDTNNYKQVIKEIILFSFDILNEIKLIKTPNGSKLSLRIGINIGDVSIGVLGNENPRLCIVGNTVNYSARLQSCAEIDTIQVSTDIYDQLQDIDFGYKLDIKMNENVFLKNIGNVTSYTIKNNSTY